jgi:hypothetical protein
MIVIVWNLFKQNKFLGVNKMKIQADINTDYKVNNGNYDKAIKSIERLNKRGVSK